MVEATINGQWTIPMAVDTGAQFALIPELGITKLGIKETAIRSVQAMTATNVRTLRRTRLQSISLGGDTLTGVGALIHDVSEVLGEGEVTGVLPMHFLNRYIVKFDLANHRLDFFERDVDVRTVPGLESSSEVAFNTLGGFIVFDVEVSGLPIKAVLDTGAGGNPIINWKVLEELGIDQNDSSIREGREVTGAGSETRITRRRDFDSFKLGDWTYDGITLDILDMNHLDMLTRNQAAMNLGLSTLGDITLVVDYKNEKLYLAAS